MSLDIDLIENSEVVWSTNITHNLGKMAKEAGVYGAMWRPDEYSSQNVTCSDIKDDLYSGMVKLLQNKEYYEQFNPENGWGSYEGLCNKVVELYVMCLKHPNAVIKVCR